MAARVGFATRPSRQRTPAKIEPDAATVAGFESEVAFHQTDTDDGDFV